MGRKPSRVNDLLGEVFSRGGMKRSIKRAEAVLLWPQVVGRSVAKFAQAVSLKDGILFVEVPDSETAMHLSFQRQKFLDVYKAKFGVKEIKEIRFRVGRRPQEKNEEAQVQRELPPDPRALASLARELATLPETVAQPAMKAAKAMLRYRARKEAEGWRPCPICAALTPDGKICTTCARYSAEERVRRAVHLLAVQPGEPTPLLSPEERQVAVHHAQAYLKERLQELLPQTLADAAMKPYLEAAARCYLAHRLKKPLGEVAEEDYDHLDSRVARALGRWR